MLVSFFILYPLSFILALFRFDMVVVDRDRAVQTAGGTGAAAKGKSPSARAAGRNAVIILGGAAGRLRRMPRRGDNQRSELEGRWSTVERIERVMVVVALPDWMSDCQDAEAHRPADPGDGRCQPSMKQPRPSFWSMAISFLELLAGLGVAGHHGQVEALRAVWMALNCSGRCYCF